MDIQTTTQEGAGTDSSADLLALAMKADAGEINADELTAPEAKPESDSPADDAKKEPAPTQEAAKEPAKEPETKPEDESKYTKAKKEQERQDRSWKKLEEEKAALRAEKEAIEKAKQDTEQAKAKAEVYRDDHGYSAEDYEAFAKSSDDPDLAERAKLKAAELRGRESATKQTVARDQFVQGWQKHLTEAIEQNPDLKDENSDMGKELKKVLAERPVFSMSPDGIKHAVEFVKLQRQSGLVSGLETENKALKEEIARLNKLTGLGGGGPAKKPGIKSAEDMTPAEREADLIRQAEELDRQG